MNQIDIQNKVETLSKDEEYMKHLLSLGSAEEMSKELEEQGIELSADDLRNIYMLAKKKAEGELSDEELESVAGGCDFVGLIILAVACAVGYGLTEYKNSCKG